MFKSCAIWPDSPSGFLELQGPAQDRQNRAILVPISKLLGFDHGLKIQDT